ncbi:hypothetical protein IWW39_002542 [Coemansia spiralis]|uniref:F-box domain-containing protein n=1 Tax=Coemansia spiralis TaxID=417178 RepID=A0A9W8GGQ8_9FUNG|nr:hypothetical protein IWW39_002542 [Coemansia spiralis]
MPLSPKLFLKKMWKVSCAKTGSPSASNPEDSSGEGLPSQNSAASYSHELADPAPVPIASAHLAERQFMWNGNGASAYIPTSPLSTSQISGMRSYMQVPPALVHHSSSGLSMSRGSLSPPALPKRNSMKRKDSFVSSTGRAADALSIASADGRLDFLSCLPYEIAMVIVIYADYPAIQTIAEVSKSWRRFARDNAVWRRLFLQQTEWRTPRALAAAGCYYHNGPRAKRAQNNGASCRNEFLAPSSALTSGTNTPRVGDEDLYATGGGYGSDVPSGSATADLNSETMQRILAAYSGSSLRPAIALQHRVAPSPSPSLVSKFGGRLVGADWRYLFNQRLKLDKNWKTGVADIQTVAGHTDSVYCVQYDHEKIVTGSRDRTVKIWDSKSLQCTRTLAGHDASVLCLKYDDVTLITGSSDSTVIIWDWQTGAPSLRLVSHAAGVLDVAFDCEHVVSCSKDCTIKVWRRSDGKLLRTLIGHRGPVNAVQLCGSRIVSASGDSLIKMWDLNTGELIRTFAGHTRGLACVQFDGKVIVSGSSDQLIKVWNAESGLCTQTLQGHKDLVRTLHFNGGRRAVSGSYDQTIKVWDIVSGECTLDLKDVHTSWVFDVQFSTSRIVSTSQDQKIVIWDFSKGLDVSDID